MRLETGQRRKVSINITSLIDVVFLLLIFFVVTSTFLEQPGLDLSLPEASSAEAAERDEVVVRVTPEGTIYVAETPVAIENLTAALEQALTSKDTTGVVLEADERVQHGRVVAVMDAARQAGARSLVVATRPDESTPTGP